MSQDLSSTASNCGAMGIDVGPCQRPAGHPGWHETNPGGWGPIWKYGWLDSTLELDPKDGRP